MIMLLVYEGHCRHICRVFDFSACLWKRNENFSFDVTRKKAVCIRIRSLTGMIVEILVEKEFTCRSQSYNGLACPDTVSVHDSFCSLKKEV